MSTLLHPKLARERARPRLDRLRSLDSEDLQAEVRLLLPDHTFDPIGGRQVTEGEIGALRDAAMRVAADCGFPGRATIEQRVRFDGRIGRLLHEQMEITPHQAGEEEVWTHLTLGPLVDLSAWRFDRLSDERVLGRGPRNTFRRLWWRAEILGAISWDEDRPLLEDETVQIMERPELAGAPAVARALAEAFRRRVSVDPGVRRMDLMRDALKRTYRLTPFLRLELLDAATLGALLDDVFLEAARAVDEDSGSEPVTAPGWESESFSATSYIAEEPEQVVGDLPVEDGHSRSSPSYNTPSSNEATVNETHTNGAVAAPNGDRRPTSFDEIPLAAMGQHLAEAVASYQRVDDEDLSHALEDALGIDIPPRRRRVVGKLAWSARSRGLLQLDEDAGVWTVGHESAGPDLRFHEWTFGRLVDRARELLAADPEPFEQLLVEIVGHARAPRIVASLVGTAINEAKRSRSRG